MPTITLPAPTGITIPALPLTGAGTVVSSGWTTAQNYASSAVTSANTFLAGLTTAANSIATIPVISDALASNSKSIGPYVAPAALSRPASLASIDDAFSTAAPTSPTLATVTMPTAPADVTLPSVPTLFSITVPTAALLSVPAFEAVLPGSPAAMSRTFSFLETSYTSGLLTSLKALLLTWVDGVATGIKPSVEQATWDRARARETLNAAQKAQEATRGFAMRGFTKPPGMLAVEMARAQQGALDANSSLSRDIAIKQADLEQTNRRFAMEQAFKVESEMMTYSNLLAQRGFEAERYAQSAAIEAYQQFVTNYNADIQLYSQRVEQWKAATQAELVKLEKYKAELEGQRLLGSANETAVRVYATQIEAATKTIELYKAKIDAANALAQVNKSKIEAYAVEVNAYGEKFRARAAQYGTVADVYSKDVQAFTAKSNAEVGRMGAEAEAYKAEASYLGTAANVRIETAKANIANLTQKMSLLIESAKGGAQVGAQMAASALSSVHMSAHIASTDSASASTNVSAAQGQNLSWTYGATISDTSSTNTATNTNRTA